LIGCDKTHEDFGFRNLDFGFTKRNKVQNNCGEKWIHEAIEADKRNGMTFFLGRDYALSAEIYQRQGDSAKAQENLNNAIDIFKECGADGWVE
jgi:tetratricopeptide (TPR) repeat protein